MDDFKEYYFTEFGSDWNYFQICDIANTFDICGDVISARYGYEGVAGFTYDWCNWYINLNIGLDLMCFICSRGEDGKE